jgi:hypothetical protein
MKRAFGICWAQCLAEQSRAEHPAEGRLFEEAMIGKAHGQISLGANEAILEASSRPG